MTCVAVTGARGFIGREFLRSSAELGWELRPLSRGDLMDGAAKAMRGCDGLLHLAALAHVLDPRVAGDDESFTTSNVALTRSVAASARAAGVRRFVFVSSAGVLGRSSPPEGFDDTSPAAPHDAYTRSKLAAEGMLAAEFGADIELVVLRPPLVYGPGARGNFGRLMRLVQTGWPLPLGALDAPRSLLGLRNLCDLLRHVLTHPAPPARPMLVADADVVGVASLLREMGRAIGRPARLVAVPPAWLRLVLGALGQGRDFERLTEPFRLRPRLVYTELGWRPPHSIAEEMDWTAAVQSAPMS